LLGWMEREEILFRTLEKYLIAERLSKGFDSDVDGFLSFSLSIQNRRKSRVGQALENHIERLLIARDIHYDRTKITENKSKPDFIFPGIEEYHNPSFNVATLTMLGVKSTCKDRWRQVLSEAEKIKHKHLLTLEAAISENQTQEMINHQLQLIVPSGLHETYSAKQKNWLMNVSSFIELVMERQEQHN
ncbi:MAG: type II restriction endonuclease, partial [Planctomycetia bacterium]|nr:type II restriction endonuclease [Planctomycetia bacterium]